MIIDGVQYATTKDWRCLVRAGYAQMRELGMDREELRVKVRFQAEKKFGRA